MSKLGQGEESLWAEEMTNARANADGQVVLDVAEREKQLRGCWRKKPITSLASAQRQAKDQSTRAEKDIKAYKCKYCPFWHTGKPQVKKKRSAR